MVVETSGRSVLARLPPNVDLEAVGAGGRRDRHRSAHAADAWTGRSAPSAPAPAVALKVSAAVVAPLKVMVQVPAVGADWKEINCCGVQPADLDVGQRIVDLEVRRAVPEVLRADVQRIRDCRCRPPGPNRGGRRSRWWRCWCAPT